MTGDHYAMSVGCAQDGTEASLRSALAGCAPELAALPIKVDPVHVASNPLWWSASAVIDGRFVVKFAWSEVQARRLWREVVLLERLARHEPLLPLPEVVALSPDPALIVTRLATGVPLSRQWASSLSTVATQHVASQLGEFLVGLHATRVADVIGDLPVVDPTPQTDTGSLRRRFPRLVDDQRGASVMRWCDWVDDVLRACDSTAPGVLVHGDLHGYNQVWDEASATLLAVVDFEESGIADPNYDLRYLPANADGTALVLAVMSAYERRSGRRLAVERVIAWHVLTALGDALWRTEAGLALPGGGSPATYVDELASRFAALALD